MSSPKTALCAALFCVLAGCVSVPPIPDMRGAVAAPALGGAAPAQATMPFLLDDNRIFVEIGLVMPDGSTRQVLAFVNMGAGAFELSNPLFRDLKPKPGQPLHLKFGAMDIALDGGAVQPENFANSIAISLDPFAGPPGMEAAARGPGGLMADLAAPLPVEVAIPPGLLQPFIVVYDYAARTMTLAAPGSLRPEGVPVPLRINPQSGLAVVDLVSDGARHPFVLDNGGSWGLIRDAGVWTSRHPGWLRSIGGIGEANYLMNGQDTGSPVLVLRGTAIGALPLDRVGVVQTGGDGMLANWVAGLFWERIYSPKAGERVEGALCGDVLKQFRLTIDYPNRMSYWLRQAPDDAHALDQVGIVLVRWKGQTGIAALALKDGAPTVSGVQPGDKLLEIDGRDTAPMTRGELLAALHGRPGETRHLMLERDGKTVEADVPVTAF